MPEKLIKASKKKARRKHGFLKRNRSHNGRKLLKRRRARGRKKI